MIVKKLNTQCMSSRLAKAERHHVSRACREIFGDVKYQHVKYLASGRYSDCFVVRISPTKDVVAKVSSYREGCLRAIARCMHSDNYEKAKQIFKADAVSISKQICTVTNLLLSKGVTPHLVWSFGNLDIKGFVSQAIRTHLAPPLRKRMKECRQEKCDLQLLYSNISFHERFHQDLTDFLHNHHITSYALKCIIFQVVYTIACLQEVMPGFRHNDLSTNNVFVNYDDQDVPHACSRYSIGNHVMYTHIPHILVAVADWDFAYCRNTVTYAGHHINLQNERVVSGAYSLKARENTTYDVHFFLTTLLPRITARPKSYGEVIKFIKMVTGRWSDRVDIFLPRLEPLQVLQHPFFEELREDPGVPVGSTFQVS